MKAILNKTVGPNFRAGDVIKGEYTRIKRLVDSGVATADHSKLGMIGCCVTWVMLSILLIFTISTFWSHEIDGFAHQNLSPLWRWTFIIASIYIIMKTLSQFYDARIPYLAYFLAFSFTIIGGILIMIGHEMATRRYQEKKTSSTAAVTLFTTGAIAFSIAFISCWNWNASVHPETGNWFNDVTTPQDFLTWMLWVFVMCVGWSLSRFFDKDFEHRRQRFISFIKRKNATIEYKTKALNYWRAYKATGNAEKFMEKNIDLIEESLDIDRQQLLPESEYYQKVTDKKSSKGKKSKDKKDKKTK